MMHVETVRHMTMHAAQVCHRDVLLMMRKIVMPVAILPSPVGKMPTASTHAGHIHVELDGPFDGRKSTGELTHSTVKSQG